MKKSLSKFIRTWLVKTYGEELQLNNVLHQGRQFSQLLIDLPKIAQDRFEILQHNSKKNYAVLKLSLLFILMFLAAILAAIYLLARSQGLIGS